MLCRWFFHHWMCYRFSTVSDNKGLAWRHFFSVFIIWEEGYFLILGPRPSTAYSVCCQSQGQNWNCCQDYIPWQFQLSNPPIIITSYCFTPHSFSGPDIYQLDWFGIWVIFFRVLDTCSEIVQLIGQRLEVPLCLQSVSCKQVKDLKYLHACNL